MEKEEIGKKIKALRKTRGLTQQQLADKLEIKRATISNYEIGRRSPHIKELEAICDVLGVGIEYFGYKGNEAIELIARAKVVFNDDNVSAEEKAHVYKEIMRLYLNMDQ